MNINHVGFADFAKWPNCGSCHPCSHQRPDKRVRDFYRKYAWSRRKRRKLTKNTEALTRDVVPKVSALNIFEFTCINRVQSQDSSEVLQRFSSKGLDKEPRKWYNIEAVGKHRCPISSVGRALDFWSRCPEFDSPMEHPTGQKRLMWGVFCFSLRFLFDEREILC